MFGFVEFCVAVVITLLLGGASLLFGAIMHWLMDSYNEVNIVEIAFFVCLIGFGVCLTILLIQNGVV